MKRYPEAIQAFRQALKIDPCIFDAYFLLAKIYEEQDNIAEAEKIYQEAARQRPLDYAVQNNLGIFYYRQGRQEDALEPLESVVKLNPNYFAAALNLGALYFSLNRRDDAKRMFKHSLSIETNFAALSNLGTLYFYEGLYDLAIDMFVKALKLDDRNFFIWGYLAESCHWNDPQENERSREYYKKAKTLAKEALLKKPGNNEILSELAFYYMRLNDHGEALAILDKLVAFKDLNQKIMSTIANCYEQMNDREKALKWIKAALGKGFPLAEINNNPGLSELRTAPRFREILKELNNKSIEGKSFKK
jgi:tetratricopeptide (TPR) repeat protein